VRVQWPRVGASRRNIGRKKIERVIELDESECLVYSLIDLFVGHSFLNQLVGTLSRTVSESNSAPSWKTMPVRIRRGKSCSSRIVEMSSPNSRMSPLSGRIRPLMSLSRTLFPTPAGRAGCVFRADRWRSLCPEVRAVHRMQSRRCERRQSDRPAAQSARRDRQDRFGRLSHWQFTVAEQGEEHWVTRKSTKMISTEATTTAWMVDRPTPSCRPWCAFRRSSRLRR